MVPRYIYLIVLGLAIAVIVVGVLLTNCKKALATAQANEKFAGCGVVAPMMPPNLLAK